jgi:hypothetical protein
MTTFSSNISNMLYACRIERVLSSPLNLYICVVLNCTNQDCNIKKCNSVVQNENGDL